MFRFLFGLSATLIVCLSLAFFVASRVDILEVATLEGEIGDETPAVMHAQVEAINDNPTIKAVLLEVNSPGGGVYASGEVRDEINRIKVPVVAYCRYLCASGGYYAMTAPSVRDIVVGSGTIIGSIGVIRVVHRQAVPPGFEIYKSGKFKQAGNVAPAVPGEKANLQLTIDEMAATFFGYVKDARGSKISAASWVRIKNAEVFDGPHGVKMGLADHVVSRDQAIALAKSESGSGGHIFTREELIDHPFRTLYRALT